ncbi:MAG: hypothetical protein ACRC2H_01135 [Silanimonas sp.]
MANHPDPWTCKNCGQRNSGWSAECGRCETAKNQAPESGPQQAATGHPKALAALREALANYLQFGALLDDSPAALELAKRAGNYLAALDAARAEAVAWVDEFGNTYPLAAHSGKGNWQDDHKRHWRRAYAAPPAALAAEYLLPCDVCLPPSTTISAGCPLSTLTSAMELRRENGIKSFPPAAPAQQPTPPPAGLAVVPEVLLEIGRRLVNDRTRNDHYTSDPIYTVQREVRIYGLDSSYADHFAWMKDSELCDSDLSERLERRFNRGWTIPGRYKRVGYCTRWDFVDAYLSYDAAKERVEYESRKHHGTYRTYVESGCRNHEWKALQAWLLAAALAERNKEGG